MKIHTLLVTVALVAAASLLSGCDDDADSTPTPNNQATLALTFSGDCQVDFAQSISVYPTGSIVPAGIGVSSGVYTSGQAPDIASDLKLGVMPGIEGVQAVTTAAAVDGRFYLQVSDLKMVAFGNSSDSSPVSGQIEILNYDRDAGIIAIDFDNVTLGAVDGSGLSCTVDGKVTTFGFQSPL